jgi:hypothetical protein
MARGSRKSSRRSGTDKGGYTENDDPNKMVRDSQQGGKEGGSGQDGGDKDKASDGVEHGDGVELRTEQDGGTQKGQQGTSTTKDMSSTNKELSTQPIKDPACDPVVVVLQNPAEGGRSPFRGGHHLSQSHSPFRGGNVGSGGRRLDDTDHTYRRHYDTQLGRHRHDHDRHPRYEPRDRDRHGRKHRRRGTTSKSRSRSRQHHRQDDGTEGSSASESTSSSSSSDDDDESLLRQRHGKKRVHDPKDQVDGVRIVKKALSYRNGPLEQKKHVAERIQVYVKGTIFRKMKFITSETILNHALRAVIEVEEPHDEEDFVRIYKTCIVGAINGKRSTCEQGGSRIVEKLLIRKEYASQGTVEPPFSMATLMKLRCGTTEREKEAFLWFIGEFVACVSGTKVWGRKKYHCRVSEAVVDKGSQQLVVTVSDEAFALLLYENYIDKWITRFHIKHHGAKSDTINGKYTSPVMNHLLFGGWSAEGVARFNELSAIVDQDRRSQGAKKAEEEVMLALRTVKYGDRVNVTDPDDEPRRRRPQIETIEAFCEM